MRPHSRPWLYPVLATGILCCGYSVLGRSTPLIHNGAAESSLPSPTVTIQQSAAVATDQHHWQSFLQLTAEPNAAITAGDVEKVFAQKLVFEQQSQGYVIPGVVRFHIVEDPIFHARYPDRKQVYTTVFFINRNPDTCITQSQFVRDLKKTGWRLLSHERKRDVPTPTYVQHLPDWDTFLKGDQGVLTITYPDGCPDSAYMRADKSLFDSLMPLVHKNIGNGND